jgi:hypothetical protein
MRWSDAKLQSNPRLTASGPIVLWYGKRGGSKASKATHFSVKPPGARTTQKFEIPKEYRKSIASRVKYVELVLKQYAAAVRKRKLAREKAKREAEELARQLAAKKKAKKVKPSAPKAKPVPPKRPTPKRLPKKLTKLEKENQKLEAEIKANELKIKQEQLRLKLEEQREALEDLKKKKLKPEKPVAPVKPPTRVVTPTPKEPKKKKPKKEKLDALDLHQMKVLGVKDIHDIDRLVPRLKNIDSRFHPKIKQFKDTDNKLKNYEVKELVGKNVKTRNQEKLEELRSEWLSQGVSRKEITARLSDKKETARTGIDTYKQKKIKISKLHVDFDQDTPVTIFQSAAKDTALTLREYFRKPAEDFLDEMRNKSENTYILRVKTKNWLAGDIVRDQGIGTERFKIWTKLPENEAAALRLEHKGMTDDEILRLYQKKQINREIDEMFNYFLDRYEHYLGRKMIEGLAVTGFTMEVVNEILH